jgi:exopolyphosphatase/pppGpp-phosphohydrolase
MESGAPAWEAIEAATASRLRTTARVMDPHPRRTTAISHVALLLFDRLVTSGAASRFRDDTLRGDLRTAAQLHAIRVGGCQTARQKAARDFLQGVPVPLGWTSQDWHFVTHVVRYQRGAEPAVRHKQFAQLSPEYQDRVCGLAGVLRLARSLHRCGVSISAGVHVEATAAYVRLLVVAVQDTEQNAARLAAAKHLLERVGGHCSSIP